MNQKKHQEVLQAERKWSQMVAWKGTGKGKYMDKYKRISTVYIKTIINVSVEVREMTNGGGQSTQFLCCQGPCLI